MASAAPRLAQLLAPVVAATGYDLEDLTVSPAGRRRVVRAVVDKDGGVSLDDVADVSRALSEALDDIDAREPALLDGAYVLEVSSPGVDRPLTEPRHWRRNVGRLVQATRREGAPVSGRLTVVDDDGVGLEDGTRLAWADLVRGQVQVEFSRGPADDPADDVDDVDDEADA